jgi:hypothetical protein
MGQVSFRRDGTGQLRERWDRSALGEMGQVSFGRDGTGHLCERWLMSARVTDGTDQLLERRDGTGQLLERSQVNFGRDVSGQQKSDRW